MLEDNPRVTLIGAHKHKFEVQLAHNRAFLLLMGWRVAEMCFPRGVGGFVRELRFNRGG